MDFLDDRTLPPLHPSLPILVLDRESELTVPILGVFSALSRRMEGLGVADSVAFGKEENPLSPPFTTPYYTQRDPISQNAPRQCRGGSVVAHKARVAHYVGEKDGC